MGPAPTGRSASQAKRSSHSRAEMGSSTIPRPTEIRKKRLQRWAPSPRTTSSIAGRLASVCLLTSVFTWKGSPPVQAERDGVPARRPKPADGLCGQERGGARRHRHREAEGPGTLDEEEE